MTDEREPTRAFQEAARRRADLHHALVDVERAISSPAAGRLDTWTGDVVKRLTILLDSIDEHIVVTERQTVSRQAGWNGNSGQACQVYRHREYVVEIHLDRIRPALLADAKGGRWRRGGQDRIYPGGKHHLEITLDERAYPLRA